MFLTNPLTGQVLNVNPEGHNQYFNPDGLRKQLKLAKLRASRNPSIQVSAGTPKASKFTKFDSYQDLIKESHLPIAFGSSQITQPSHGHTARGGASETSVRISPGLFDREVAAHEIGHTKVGFKPRYEGDFLNSGIISEEEAAWKWAIENAPKLKLSRRKLRRIKRVASGEYQNEFKRQILSAPLKSKNW